MKDYASALRLKTAKIPPKKFSVQIQCLAEIVRVKHLFTALRLKISQFVLCLCLSEQFFPSLSVSFVNIWVNVQ